MFTIANPIYDVFFKYLMQDEAAAVCLLSAVLDQEITLLECLPQERAVSSEERPELSVIRFDYRATIQQEDGSFRKVLIELQKIRRMETIGRFRRYLASNYATPDKIDGQEVHLPIITIYLLGFELAVRSPVIRVGGTYTDAVTKKSIEGLDEFIDALTHQAYFIQIPRLPNKQQSRVERVLSIFSQQWVVETDSKRILQIPDELRSQDNEPLVHRLSLAVADNDLQQSAIESEAFDQSLRQELGQEFQKGMEQGIEKGKVEGLEQGKAEGLREGLLQTARNMKNVGLPPEQIADFTSLSLQEIDSL
jgi:predicted transposase/invertase (TIGR01784 family)